MGKRGDVGEGEKHGERARGRMDGRTYERTNGWVSERVRERERRRQRPARERDGTRVEGQRASERGLVARFGTV